MFTAHPDDEAAMADPARSVLRHPVATLAWRAGAVPPTRVVAVSGGTVASTLVEVLVSGMGRAAMAAASGTVSERAPVTP
jgi:hypothetical protein